MTDFRKILKYQIS